MSMVQTLLAFLGALTLLIFVHEMGHYWVARRCGVRVLRFSIGFGRPLLRWHSGVDRTEWVVGMIPLGGYVKMLDERDLGQEVDPAEFHRAFNRKSLGARSAVVIAGPAANFLLAIVLYAALGFIGVEEPAPIVGTPPAASAAADAGLRTGDRIVAVAGVPLRSWQELRLRLIEPLIERRAVDLDVQRDGAKLALSLSLAGLPEGEEERNFLGTLGISLAPGPVFVGRLSPDGAAQRDGLREGDEILAIDAEPVRGSRDMVNRIRESPGRMLTFAVRRDGGTVRIAVQPDAVLSERPGEEELRVGRIGAALQERVQMETVRHGALASFAEGARRTWDMSWFSLRMLGKMVQGELSLRNLSGPVTIADLAGQTARIGWQAYVNFLALISISLGVLNLLPIPVLDGGHLVYYGLEALWRRPLPERFMEFTQKAGVGMLVLLMAVALFNDLVRLIGH